MAFLNKLGDFARNIGDKAADTIEITKLGSKINTEQTAITACMRQIGEIYYQKYQDGEALDPAAAEIFVTINGHYQTIADAQAEIDRIKAENAAAAAAAATPAPAPVPAPAAEGIPCSACGAANPAGTKFCSTCGNKLESPAPVPENRVCPDCGAQVSLSSKFCGKCGYKFEEQ